MQKNVVFSPSFPQSFSDSLYDYDYSVNGDTTNIGLLVTTKPFDELIKNGFGIGIGNPIHYKSKDFIILNTNFNLPTRKFDIGYITTSKNELIKEFINILNK